MHLARLPPLAVYRLPIGICCMSRLGKLLRSSPRNSSSRALRSRAGLDSIPMTDRLVHSRVDGSMVEKVDES